MRVRVERGYKSLYPFCSVWKSPLLEDSFLALGLKTSLSFLCPRPIFWPRTQGRHLTVVYPVFLQLPSTSFLGVSWSSLNCVFSSPHLKYETTVPNCRTEDDLCSSTSLLFTCCVPSFHSFLLFFPLKPFYSDYIFPWLTDCSCTHLASCNQLISALQKAENYKEIHPFSSHICNYFPWNNFILH